MSMKMSLAAFLLTLTLPRVADAAMPVDVEIIDRRTGQALPVYWHDGERHIAGEPGREYEIRLRNRSGARILAVTSVDGVNAITGQTASQLGSGYVLDPWASAEIDGWRKSLAEVAAFYFTALPDSYAARTGRPDSVGVIGVALFREVERRPFLEEDYAQHAEAPAPAGAAAESKAARNRDSDAPADQRLGTGHGRRLNSGARYTEFERASDSPDAVVRIYYDSRRNLIARGIIPQPSWHVARRVPDPFPGGFVPDP